MKKWEIAITNDQISLDEIIKSATSHLYNWRSYMAKLDSMEKCLLDLQWNNWTCKVIHVAAGNKSFRKQDVNGYTTLEWFYSLKLSIVQFFSPSQFQTFFFFFSGQTHRCYVIPNPKEVNSSILLFFKWQDWKNFYVMKQSHFMPLDFWINHLIILSKCVIRSNLLTII